VNCQTALETLELVRPDTPDVARVAEAEQHVSGCGSCRAAVRQREEFDARVGGMCRDVSIPPGLKERLLARIDELATSTPATSTATRAIPPVVDSRRRWLGMASLTVASLIAVGIGTWSLWPARPVVDVEEITGLMTTAGIDPANLPEFTTFTGGLAPQPPGTMRTGLVVSPPRRLGKFEAAIYFFKLGGRDGRLAVVPRRFVKAGGLPTATSLLSGSTSYWPGFCTTAWVEGNFVYICCLSRSGGEPELHKLAQPRPPSA
jgi:hypothetical protein